MRNSLETYLEQLGHSLQLLPEEQRAAELKFSRATEYLGDVGAHPQDPSLKPPLPDNL